MPSGNLGDKIAVQNQEGENEASTPSSTTTMPSFDKIILEVDGMSPISFATFFEERVAQAEAAVKEVAKSAEFKFNFGKEKETDQLEVEDNQGGTEALRCRAVVEAVGPMPLPGRPRQIQGPNSIRKFLT